MGLQGPRSKAANATAPARRTPTQERAKATVTKLLDALGEYVAEHGFRTLNATAIAARAGVGVGTLYGYFPDIFAVLEAYAERSLAAWLELWRRTPAFEPYEDWRNAYHRAYRATLEHAKDDYAYILLLNAAGVAPELNDVVARIRAAHIQASVEILQHANADLPPGHAEAIAAVMLRAGWGGVLDVLITGDEVLRDEFEELMVRYLSTYIEGGRAR